MNSLAHSPRPRGLVLAYWLFTVLFCLQIGFTAFAQLKLPQVAAAFVHMGFPPYFRVELAWAKLAGLVVLLLPFPERAREWAYCGFFITLVSALIAHFAIHEGVKAWGFAAGTLVLWLGSYICWRKLA